jgi:hypothetical protein
VLDFYFIPTYFKCQKLMPKLIGINDLGKLPLSAVWKRNGSLNNPMPALFSAAT